jgi:transposase
MKRVRESGLEALRSCKGEPKPKISEEELQQLPEFLERGPEAYGFRGDVWTRARVGAVIKKEVVVSYSDTHVGRLLDEIDWSRQKPAVGTTRKRDQDVLEVLQGLIGPPAPTQPARGLAS